MKSRKSGGLFPRARSRPPATNEYGGSAGNSRSNNRPTSGDGYKEGDLGWRSSSQSGGESMAQKVAGRPMPNDRSITGQGGLAWDRSAGAAMSEATRDRLANKKGRLS